MKKNYKLVPTTIQILTRFMLYSSMEMLCGPDGELPEKLRNLEPRLIEHVSNEIMDRDPNVRWDDIGNTRCFVPYIIQYSCVLYGNVLI